MEEFKPLKEILKEEMRAKGLNVQKLSELTDIAPYYIKALLENDFSKLPAAPYVRGYLNSIAKILEIDPQPLWEEFKKEAEIKRSGESDKLPTNRYAPKPINKLSLALVLIVLIIFALLFPRIADFVGQPSIEIISPPSDMYQTQQDTFTLEGKISSPSDKLLINGDEVVVNPDGSFQKQVILGPRCNNNVFEFTVKRFLGLSTSVKRTICLTAPVDQQVIAPTTTPISTSTNNIQ
jgi:cell division protein FtsL